MFPHLDIGPRATHPPARCAAGFSRQPRLLPAAALKRGYQNAWPVGDDRIRSSTVLLAASLRPAWSSFMWREANILWNSLVSSDGKLPLLRSTRGRETPGGARKPRRYFYCPGLLRGDWAAYAPPTAAPN